MTKKIVRIQDYVFAIVLREYDDGVYTSAGFVQQYDEVENYEGSLWINSYAALELPVNWKDHLVNKIDIRPDGVIGLSMEQYTITDIDWNLAQAYDKDEMPVGSPKPVFTLSDGSKVNKVWFTQELVK